MIDSKTYIHSLFTAKQIHVPKSKIDLFETFVSSKENIEAVNKILETQQLLMENWKVKNRVSDIIAQQFIIPNATVNKPYQVKIDFGQLNLSDLIFYRFEGLEQIGLKYDESTNTIEGSPAKSGDIKFKFLFNINGEQENIAANEKLVSLVVNPDPKSLWKELPSDKNNIYWKEDDVAICEILGNKKLVVASKRGRSHENVGSFRDDDFAYKNFRTGWAVVAVADGAGSYSLSRKGSQLACSGVIEYFEKYSDVEKSEEFEAKLLEFDKSKDETLLSEIEMLAKQNLYKATVFVHNKIKEHAEATFKTNPELFNNPKAKSPLDYYHSTLVFSLFKKYDFGFVILTFGVGDCPVAVINKQETQASLLNWLDVGEFGGGTRFITQPEIFHSTEHPMATRFNFRIITDFSYLFLMTDGIYDPKFSVEANLEKTEKWKDFIADLGGKNEENIKIDFTSHSTDIANNLSKWMDFWSAGNHDDRTLAIVF